MSASVLRGRPFGGMGFLLKHDLCQHVMYQHLDERFAIVFDNIVLTTIYLPSGSTIEDIDIITETLVNIDIILTQLQPQAIIFRVMLCKFGWHAASNTNYQVIYE